MIKNIKSFIKKKIHIEPRLPVNINKYFLNNKPIRLIDVGAYEGEFSKSIDNYCGISLGILIEPIYEKYKVLKENFKEPKFKIYNCALSYECGSSEFNINQFEFTSSLLEFRSSLQELDNINTNLKKKVECNTITLDKLFEELQLTNIELLKIDVQGAEHLVLNGAIDSLSKVNFICIEVSFKKIYKNSSLFQDIYNFLYKNKFILLEIQPAYRSSNNELLQADALFMKL